MDQDKEKLFPCEDLDFGGSVLYVDLVPSSSWGDNLRGLMTSAKWKSLSKAVCERAKGVCEICQFSPSVKSKIRIECHERWLFDARHGTQTLKRLVALCSRCHRATHFGFAQSIGRGPASFGHIKKVNGWTDLEVISHIEEAFQAWEKRSAMPWALVVDPMLVSTYFKRPLPPNPYSPCVKVCQMDGDKCLGCGRSIDQIASWSSLPLQDRFIATSRLRQRLISASDET